MMYMGVFIEFGAHLMACWSQLMRASCSHLFLSPLRGGIFTPWKSANTVYEGFFFFLKEPVVKHLLANSPHIASTQQMELLLSVMHSFL